MFENFRNIFKRVKKKDLQKSNSKETAKERLHLVLMQDRVNVSADFLDLMRAEVVEVLKKYIEIDENGVDIRLTTEINENGEQSVPALYANIPIIKIKEDTRSVKKNDQGEQIKIDLLNIEKNELEKKEEETETESEEVEEAVVESEEVEEAEAEDEEVEEAEAESEEVEEAETESDEVEEAETESEEVEEAETESEETEENDHIEPDENNQEKDMGKEDNEE